MPKDFEAIGSPSMSNIMEIRLGIINNTSVARSGKIWVNEIYIEDPQKRIGRAMTGSFSSSIPRSASASNRPGPDAWVGQLKRIAIFRSFKTPASKLLRL